MSEPLDDFDLEVSALGRASASVDGDERDASSTPDDVELDDVAYSSCLRGGAPTANPATPPRWQRHCPSHPARHRHSTRSHQQS